ncbi:MAG: hypothetical protein F2681_03115 [Actinobacteria bacterium]|jgi:hypothetical protein|uniref:Unannotated protein n=1 Tax=freshwater metagenome TaxID=449393 RepID=A0A6J6QEU7_9ZZZZ|nr:hypothetical protein [Actinomycetota bacterium]MSW76667.1 hypothetical protein [Actinomycetota bacterium]MSX54097.1 hypothetical protein [Actinomycetota bacterium]MSX91802.1 hypothetical protein [Actinomycetota bacterium]MSZ82114.1 hypothetical protein [Actinomycetota bacterium]
MSPPTDSTPHWRSLIAFTVLAAVLFAFAASPRTGLYWYIFPLFGLGGAYLLQFRVQLPLRWRLTFGASAVLSAVALGLNWPFSGHVLWNVLFIGHASLTGKRRSTWMLLLLASLVYLFVLKAVSQTGRDAIGGVISIAVAAVALLMLRRRPIRPAT